MKPFKAFSEALELLARNGNRAMSFRTESWPGMVADYWTYDPSVSFAAYRVYPASEKWVSGNAGPVRAKNGPVSRFHR